MSLIRFLIFQIAFWCMSIAVEAQCDIFTPAGLSCLEAPLLTAEDFSTGQVFCSSLPLDNPSDELIPFCQGVGTSENTAFFQFYPATASLSFQINPSNCDTLENPLGQFTGMQATAFAACDFDATLDCVVPCMNETFVLSLQTLEPGGLYILALDGCAGSLCDFSIKLTEGELMNLIPGLLPQVHGPATSCTNEPAVFSISEMPDQAAAQWSVVPSISFSTFDNGRIMQLVNMPPAGLYQVCTNIDLSPPSGPWVDTCMSIEIFDTPQVISISEDTSLCSFELLPLELEVLFADQVTWTGPEGLLSCTDCLNPTLAFQDEAVLIQVEILNTSTGCSLMQDVFIDLNEEVACINNNTVQNASYGIRLFPNPTSEKLIIESDQTAGQIKILDMHGKMIYRWNMQDRMAALDVSGWPAGIYLMQLQLPSGQRIQRSWVKQ